MIVHEIKSVTLRVEMEDANRDIVLRMDRADFEFTTAEVEERAEVGQLPSIGDTHQRYDHTGERSLKINIKSIDRAARRAFLAQGGR